MNAGIRTIAQRPHAQRGLSLIELLVAIALSVFLLFGLFTIVQSTRTAYTNQNYLAQLQDGQRLAMTMLNDVVQTAGYFPDPTKYTLAASFPALNVGNVGSVSTNTGKPISLAAADPIYGVYQSNAVYQPTNNLQGATWAEDEIAVEYMTTGKDGITLCDGSSNTDATGTVHMWLNIFYIDLTTDPNNPALTCILYKDGVQTANVPLVSGIQSMQIYYGVKRGANATADANVDTYVPAADMTASDWLAASSVKVDLYFTNPLYQTASGAVVPGQSKYPTLMFEKVISLMYRAGVQVVAQ